MLANKFSAIELLTYEKDYLKLLCKTVYNETVN